MKKKVALTAAAVAMVGTLAVGGTLAWFTDTETATNVVTMGNVDILLNEDGSNDNDRLEGVSTEEGLKYDNILPGDVINKDVNITLAEGSNDAWVRAKISVKGSLVNGSDSSVPSNYITFLNDNTPVLTGTWVYDDGEGEWYTYVECPNKLVDQESGNKFEVFDQVQFNGENMGNEFENSDALTIKVVAEAIQADNVEDGVWEKFTNSGNKDEEKNPDAEGTITPSSGADEGAGVVEG